MRKAIKVTYVVVTSVMAALFLLVVAVAIYQAHEPHTSQQHATTGVQVPWSDVYNPGACVVGNYAVSAVYGELICYPPGSHGCNGGSCWASP